MNGEKRRDLIAYLLFVLFGIVLWIAIPALVPGKPGFQVDSRLFPRFIAILLIVIGSLSAAAVLISARKDAAKGADGAEQRQPEEQAPSQTVADGAADSGKHVKLISTLRVAAMIAIILAYALLIEPIGFIPATFLSVTAVLLLEQTKKITYYAVTYGACIFLYLIFRYLLYVQL